MTICVAIASGYQCQGHFDPWEGTQYFHQAHQAHEEI
jgi:hypothetical protein